jgi:glycosidase
MEQRSAPPLIYEINTWVWLNELSRQHGRKVTLAGVPDAQWETIAGLGFDTVWLMGVWERSPAGVQIAREYAPFQEEFPQVLPDYNPDEDLIGSPYCVHQYRVDKRLGGPDELATVRERLSTFGLRLILDFVPNHVAPDHPWTTEHPEYFIQGSPEDLAEAPEAFFTVGENILARGKDPFFPPWPEVAQLNAFNPGLREAVIATLNDIATQCDGVRCDMAMLLTTDVFARTWGERAGPPPANDYWREVIPAVKAQHPGFVFIAEAYWDLEWELQQQGFDFCYDKRLYDRLVHDDARAVRGHLQADLDYQNKLLRFIENHDEPRAAATFSPEKERAAAVTFSTLPGACLFYDGQFDGRKVRLPVLLGRQPEEAPDSELNDFHTRLMEAISTVGVRQGEWRLCETTGWPDNQSHENLVAWSWHHDEHRALVVVNLSGGSVQAHVRLPWNDLGGSQWTLDDHLACTSFEREGDDIAGSGLYVGLDGWGSHIFSLKRAPA